MATILNLIPSFVNSNERILLYYHCYYLNLKSQVAPYPMDRSTWLLIILFEIPYFL